MMTSRWVRAAVILSCCCLILMLVTLLLCCRNGVPAAQKSGNTIGGDNIDQPARSNVSVSDRMNLNYDNDTNSETYSNKMEDYLNNTQIDIIKTINTEETSIRNLLVSDDYLMVAPDSESAPVKEGDEGESISHQGTGEPDSEDLIGSEVPGPISWVGQND